MLWISHLLYCNCFNCQYLHRNGWWKFISPKTKNRNEFFSTFDTMKAAAQIAIHGYIDFGRWSKSDLYAEIDRLKKKNAVVLGALSVWWYTRYCWFCGRQFTAFSGSSPYQSWHHCLSGVHFMAETAKILFPGKKSSFWTWRPDVHDLILVPHPLFAKFKEKHPDHVVVSYVNCTRRAEGPIIDVYLHFFQSVHIVIVSPRIARSFCIGQKTYRCLFAESDRPQDVVVG